MTASARVPLGERNRRQHDAVGHEFQMLHRHHRPEGDPGDQLSTPAGRVISSPASRPFSVNESSGPLETKVRPALSAASQLRYWSAGPERTKTRFMPTGPRSEAKLAIASVLAPAGILKPALRSRYQTPAVAR